MRSFPRGALGGFLIFALIGWATDYGLLQSEHKLANPEGAGELFFAMFGMANFGMLVGSLLDTCTVPLLSGELDRESGRILVLLRMGLGFAGMMAGMAVAFAVISALGIPRQSGESGILVGVCLTCGTTLGMVLQAFLSRGPLGPVINYLASILLTCLGIVWATLGLGHLPAGETVTPQRLGVIFTVVLLALGLRLMRRPRSA